MNTNSFVTKNIFYAKSNSPNHQSNVKNDKNGIDLSVNIKNNTSHNIGTGVNQNNNNNNDDISCEMSRKESFVTNVSRRYQDFQDEESIGDDGDCDFDINENHKKSPFVHESSNNNYNKNTNISNCMTPEKSYSNNQHDLSPIANNNQSRITLQSYLISNDTNNIR